MTQSSGKAKVNEVKMLEDKSGKKAIAPESKKVDLEKNETKVETHAGPSVGASMTGKKYMSKMKSLKRKHVEASDSDSDADEDWVTFLSLGGRFRQ